MTGELIIHNTTSFLRKNVVMVIAMAAALLTMFFVPPDGQYLGYFDVKTLTCLFCVLAVVCALKNIQFFYILAQQIVRCFRNARLAILALVYITFIGSMLIANDMALLTFLPLGYLVLTSTGKQRYMAFTFIMQNIAANLGGMLTPFGNPQNLYLYTKFNIPTAEFMSIMVLPFAVAVVLITICCIVFVKPEPLEVKAEKPHLPIGRTVLYLALFALSILDRADRDPGGADFCRSKGTENGGLSPASDLYLFLHFLRQYGKNRSGAEFVLLSAGKEHAFNEHPVLPDHQQRAHSHFAVPVYGKLSGTAFGREYRRRRHADILSGQPHHLPGIQQSQSRQEWLLSALF